jgi:hypothetical protein
MAATQWLAMQAATTATTAATAITATTAVVAAAIIAAVVTGTVISHCWLSLVIVVGCCH